MDRKIKRKGFNEKFKDETSGILNLQNHIAAINYMLQKDFSPGLIMPVDGLPVAVCMQDTGLKIILYI